MKRNLLILIALLTFGCAHGPRYQDTVFQNAPINALLAGCYTGTTRVADLSKQGDFGIGTLDALDGEMVALDGVFYQIQADGKALRLEGSSLSPFATVTLFNEGPTVSIPRAMGYELFQAFLDSKRSSENLIYAIKVDGKFSSLKVRSAARQQKPYPVLTEAIKDQKVFELKDQEGTLVGFWFPKYVAGVNVPGYHFHFLNKDRTLGGHVQDLQVEDARIQIDTSHGFKMHLPGNAEFLKFQFEENAEEAIQKIEK